VHNQKVTIELLAVYPDHEPRNEDPHYVYFREARERLKSLGKLRCWICGTDKNVELHHDKVEYALINGVDIEKFRETFPEFGISSDEDFLRFVESEGNLTPLCTLHHRGYLGIHNLPYPLWLPQKFWKSNLPPPARTITEDSSESKQHVNERENHAKE
jgi:hypothetical protein